MAGRPLSMIKRVAALEEVAYNLARDLAEACPDKYRSEEKPTFKADERLIYWKKALSATEKAAQAMNFLLMTLEEAAGLDADEMDRQRDEKRGLWWPIEEASATEGVEVVGTSET